MVVVGVESSVSSSHSSSSSSSSVGEALSDGASSNKPANNPLELVVDEAVSDEEDKIDVNKSDSVIVVLKLPC